MPWAMSPNIYSIMTFQPRSTGHAFLNLIMTYQPRSIVIATDHVTKYIFNNDLSAKIYKACLLIFNNDLSTKIYWACHGPCPQIYSIRTFQSGSTVHAPPKMSSYQPSPTVHDPHTCIHIPFVFISQLS